MSKRLLKTCAFRIDRDLVDELKYVGKKQNVSLSVILLSVFKILLFRHIEQPDLQVATPNATFSDILLLRTSLNGDEPFDSLLARIKEIIREAHLHAGKAFKEIDQSGSKAGIHDPLHQYMFVLQNFAEEELNRDKFDETVSRFGLTLSITQTSDSLQAYFIYSRHAFNEELIDQMIGHYKQLLHAVVLQEQQKIGELPMLTIEEHELLDQLNCTSIEYPAGSTIIDLFEEQAELNPDATAIIFSDQELTYRQLNERSNQVAHLLRLKGVKDETVVPIVLDRSIEMIVAILGIWKAGGAYVPIDHESPATRIAYVLRDTGAKIALCDIVARKELLPSNLDVVSINDSGIENFPISNLNSKPTPQQLAYIIYTSGSTGRPKGVMVEHKSIFNYILNSKAQFITNNKRSSGTFVHLAYTFDASLKSMLTPLVSGKLIVISSKPLAYVFEDVNLHKYAPYDFIQLTPSHLDFFYLVCKDGHGRAVTGKISIGGEALYKNHFDPLIETGEKLTVINEYGPTEATVACSGYSFDISGEKVIPQRLPIGKPIANTQVYILNEHHQPVPLGVTGEICVGGVQVARGYLNSPDLTRKRFIANPFYQRSGETIYKTGDMGRWLPDGNIECLGRKDDQVKIRGYRVEPGEIESILIKNEMIRQVTVIPREDSDGRKRLIAYVVPNGLFNKQEIISYLQVWLPNYMIPESWIIQEELPLTPNGKIDRNVLPEPELRILVNEGELQENFEAPRTKEEQTIASIWQDVLGVQQVGIKDNFFEVGEPSVLAIKVLRLVEELTGKYLPLSTIYENPTLETFVKRLQDIK